MPGVRMCKEICPLARKCEEVEKKVNQTDRDMLTGAVIFRETWAVRGVVLKYQGFSYRYGITFLFTGETGLYLSEEVDRRSWKVGCDIVKQLLDERYHSGGGGSSYVKCPHVRSNLRDGSLKFSYNNEG